MGRPGIRGGAVHRPEVTERGELEVAAMRFQILSAAVLVLIITDVASVGATTICVPGDQPTIQAAIHVASPFDTVLVAPGGYTGAANLVKSVHICSEAGPDSTFLRDPSSVFFSYPSEPIIDTIIQIEGFTLHGCNRSAMKMYLYSLHLYAFYLTIRDCHFIGNHGGEHGGAIDFRRGVGIATTRLTIEDCAVYSEFRARRGAVGDVGDLRSGWKVGGEAPCGRQYDVDAISNATLWHLLRTMAG